MPHSSFDDAAVRTAMREYLAAAAALEEASEVGDAARQLLDLAESKAIAAMALRKRLVDLGWSAPTAQRTTT